MEINWFTFLAQLLNFFVLVWLLKRFLYKPILNAIDEREKNIVSQLQYATEKEAEAILEKSEFQKRNESFDQERKELMDKAIADTNEEREKRLENTRNEVAELRLKLESTLVEMQENMKQELIQKTKKEVLAIAKMTLHSLASISLEEQTIAIFLNHLKEQSLKDKNRFIKAFKESKKPIEIISAFDLSEKQKAEIEQAISSIIEQKPFIQTSIKPELICGIELITNGFKLAWSISEFIETFEKSISETKIEEYEN